MSVFAYGYGFGNVSNSMLQDYASCSLKARLRWGPDRFESQPGLSATSAGSIVHAAMENHFESSKARWQYTFETLQASGLLRELTEETFHRYKSFVSSFLDRRPDGVSPSYKSEKAAALTAGLSSGAAETVLDTLTPAEFLDVIMVSLFNADKLNLAEHFDGFDKEVKLSAKASDLVGPLPLDLNIVGTADLLFTDPSHIIIGDYKTGRKQWTPKTIKNSPQFCLYGELARRRADRPGASVGVAVVDLRHGKIVRALLHDEDFNRYRLYLKVLLNTYAATESGSLFILPSDGDIGCPCDFAKLGRCAYKLPK